MVGRKKRKAEKEPQRWDCPNCDWYILYYDYDAVVVDRISDHEKDCELYKKLQAEDAEDLANRKEAVNPYAQLKFEP